MSIERHTWDFAHYFFLDEMGRAPGHLDPSKLTDEVKEVTHYEWEFLGRDFLSVSPNGREIIDQEFHREIELKTQVSVRSTPSNVQSKIIFGNVTLAKLR